MPSLVNAHVAALTFYLISYPTGIFTFPIFIGAQLIGIVRRIGMPKMQMDYAQHLVFLEEFQNLTYMMSISMSKGGLFLNTPVLVGTILTLCLEFKKILDRNPSTPILSIGSLKDKILKGA